jgi:hypothetical protein
MGPSGQGWLTVAYRQARRCSAHRTDGQPCSAWAVHGSVVCASHGARAPQVKKAAGRRAARADAERACVALGVQVETTPEAALQDELAWCNGHVAWLRGQVAELTVADLATDAGGALVGLYSAERDRLVTIARVMIAADVHGRAVELARSVAAYIGAVVDGLIEDLALNQEQAALIPDRLPARIRAVPFPLPGGDGDDAA